MFECIYWEVHAIRLDLKTRTLHMIFKSICIHPRHPNTLLMEEILHQLIASFSHYLWVFSSQVVVFSPEILPSTSQNLTNLRHRVRHSTRHGCGRGCWTWASGKDSVVETSLDAVGHTPSSRLAELLFLPWLNFCEKFKLMDLGDPKPRLDLRGKKCEVPSN